jgi:hypothetical protein
MPGHLLRYAFAVCAAWFVAGCENTPTKQESTAGEISDVASGGAAAVGAQTFHIRSKGPLAQVSFHTELPTGVFFGFLEVFGGGPLVRDQQLLLFYSIERCDPVAGVCDTAEQGSGLIPPGDLIVRGRKTILRTNTSMGANPAFERFMGSGGAINLEWIRTSAIVTSSRVQSRTRIKGVLLDHFRFHSTLSSALTEGSLLGLELDPGNSGGNVGTVHSGVITVAKSP